MGPAPQEVFPSVTDYRLPTTTQGETLRLGSEHHRVICSGDQPDTDGYERGKN